MPAPPQRVFISYSHDDEALKIRLRKQLSAMEKAGLIAVWDDRAIPAGGHWEQQILDHLEAADLVLLLISASFIASDYCYGEEMSRAVQRHALGRAVLVPVLLRPCQWELLPFVDEHKIQLLPRDAKAVTDLRHWGSEDEALSRVATDLLDLVRARSAPAADSHGAWAAGPAAAAPSPQGEATRTDRPEIPRMLPDLCNRGDQDTAFDLALRDSRRRPFVFVLYGEDAERLHGFRDRLAQVRVPRALNLERSQTSVECVTLENLVLSVYRQPADAFRAELGERLVEDRGATVAQLADYVSGHQRTLMLVSHFVGPEGLAHLRKTAAGMLAFWSQWPDLAASRHLLHCLSVRMARAPAGSAPAPAPASHDDTRRLLRRLTERDGRFKDHPAVAGGVLPELVSVQRWHVEQWAESREVRRLTRIEPEDVAALFEQSTDRKADGSIAMEPLYPRIYQLAVDRRT